MVPEPNVREAAGRSNDARGVFLGSRSYRRTSPCEMPQQDRMTHKGPSYLPRIKVTNCAADPPDRVEEDLPGARARGGRPGLAEEPVRPEVQGGRGGQGRLVLPRS